MRAQTGYGIDIAKSDRTTTDDQHGARQGGDLNTLRKYAGLKNRISLNQWVKLIDFQAKL